MSKMMGKNRFRTILGCITLVSGVIASTCLAAQSVPDDFVLLTDVVPDVMLDIRYYSTFNFVGSRIDGYEEPVAIVTRKAANALALVNEDLRSTGYRLKVFDAYRPQAAVDHFVRWAGNPSDVTTKQYFYPDIDKSLVFDLGYVARYSGHSRGSTVDLTLYDMKNQTDVDMGGTFDFFGERSYPNYQYLTEEQIKNRKFLRKIMEKNGFRGIPTEWWHYTLEDEPYPNTYFEFYVKSI